MKRQLNATVAAASVTVQGISDSYTATAGYRQPVVTTIPLHVLSESDRQTALLPASALPSVNPRHRHRHHQQLLQQQTDNGNTVDRSSCEDHHYSEINGETSLASPTSSSSSLSSAAAAAVTMTSSGHVTETDTPTNQAHMTDAAVAEYSVLDTATIADPPSLPSVYQTLNDRNPSS